MSSSCKAVIYDMDGIMIDSEPFWHEAEIECFAKVDIDLVKQDCEDTMGVRIADIVDMRYKQKPWDENKIMTRNELTDLILDDVIDKVLNKGLPLKGLKQSLNYLKSKNPSLKLAVASSSHMRLIKAVMKRLNNFVDIENSFLLYESAELLKYGKPHPQVYLNAANKLGVLPRQCLAIEDSLSGTLSAKAAQMKVISIPFDYPNHNIKFEIADKILPSLDCIDDNVWNQIWHPNKSKL